MSDLVNDVGFGTTIRIECNWAGSQHGRQAELNNHRASAWSAAKNSQLGSVEERKKQYAKKIIILAMLLLAWLTQTAVHASPPGPIGNDPGCYPDYYGPVYVVWDVPEGQIDGAKIYRHIQDSSNSTVYEEWELIATLYTDENGVPTSFEDSYSECASLVDDYMTGNVSYSIILFNGDGDSSDGPHPGFGVFGY